MLDFQSVRDRKKKITELSQGLTRDDLRALTNEMIDAQLALIKDCTDADVVFRPIDPKAKDDAAATEAEKNISWTLGHLIVHCTASTEESAFIAAELRVVYRITVARATRRIGKPSKQLRSAAHV